MITDFCVIMCEKLSQHGIKMPYLSIECYSLNQSINHFIVPLVAKIGLDKPRECWKILLIEKNVILKIRRSVQFLKLFCHTNEIKSNGIGVMAWHSKLTHFYLQCKYLLRDYQVSNLIKFDDSTKCSHKLLNFIPTLRYVD